MAGRGAPRTARLSAGVSMRAASAIFAFLFLNPALLLASLSVGTAAASASGGVRAPASSDLRVAEGAAVTSFGAGGSHRAMFADDEVVQEALFSVQLRSILEETHAKAGPALLLMVYSGWCPYCLFYSRTFSSVAKALSRYFRFAAFNCAESRELAEVCAALRVHSVPSIKLIVPKSMHDSLGLSVTAEGTFAQSSPTQGSSMKSRIREDGGVLDGLFPLSGFGLSSLTSANSSAMRFYIYTLDMPGEDLRPPLRFAADRAGVTLQDKDLSLVALERLLQSRESSSGASSSSPHARVCGASRWNSDEASRASLKASSLAGAVAANSAKGRSLARHRLHDAVKGLQFLLSSWITSVGVAAEPQSPSSLVAHSETVRRLSGSAEEALVRLLEVVRELVPLQAVKLAAAQALIFVHSKRMRVSSPAASLSLLHHLEHRRQQQQTPYRGTVSVSEWSEFISKISFGEEHPPLQPLQMPEFVVCETVTCSLWMLFHFLAESAETQAKTVFASGKCANVGGRILETRQPLPVMLMEGFSVRNSRRQLDVLDLVVLSKTDLIEKHPHLGCGFLSAHDIAVTFREVVARFFGCKTCQTHFARNFELGLYGLSALTPPGTDSASASFSGVGKAGQVSARQSLLRTEVEKQTALRLWLWRVHNAVSVRVAADTTLSFWSGDSNAKNFENCDTRWPSVESCKSCRKPGSVPPSTSLVSSESLSLAAKADGVGIQPSSEDFDERQILAHLHEQYWPSEFDTSSS